jgi:hypothetical protein
MKTRSSLAVFGVDPQAGFQGTHELPDLFGANVGGSVEFYRFEPRKNFRERRAFLRILFPAIPDQTPPGKTKFGVFDRVRPRPIFRIIESAGKSCENPGWWANIASRINRNEKISLFRVGWFSKHSGGV